MACSVCPPGFWPRWGHVLRVVYAIVVPRSSPAAAAVVVAPGTGSGQTCGRAWSCIFLPVGVSTACASPCLVYSFITLILLAKPYTCSSAAVFCRSLCGDRAVVLRHLHIVALDFVVCTSAGLPSTHGLQRRHRYVVSVSVVVSLFAAAGLGFRWFRYWARLSVWLSPVFLRSARDVWFLSLWFPSTIR